MTRSGGWILLAFLTTAPVAAQNAGPFSDLARRVAVGDDVRITLSGGRELTARVAGVTPDTLSVLHRGVRRDLGEADVWVVDHRLEDSNANGCLARLRGWRRVRRVRGLRHLGVAAAEHRRGDQGPDHDGRALRRRRCLGRVRLRPPDQAGGRGLPPICRTTPGRGAAALTRAPRRRPLGQLLRRRMLRSCSRFDAHRHQGQDDAGAAGHALLPGAGGLVRAQLDASVPQAGDAAPLGPVAGSRRPAARRGSGRGGPPGAQAPLRSRLDHGDHRRTPAPAPRSSSRGPESAPYSIVAGHPPRRFLGRGRFGDQPR